jgi:hypothetical protein
MGTEPSIDIIASEEAPDDAPREFTFDTPEDKARYEAAAAFIAETGIEGSVEPLFTQYRPEQGLDTVILTVDGRNMVLRHAGTKSPQIEYGDDEDGDWTFRSEHGNPALKTEYEILSELVAGARHDAACQEAWRFDPSGKTFQHGATVSVNDFGVRFHEDGTRIVTVDLGRDRQEWELVQRGDDDVKVIISGQEGHFPLTLLDALASEFDEDHVDGTGGLRWKDMMMAAADRAANEPGYNPRGVNRP